MLRVQRLGEDGDVRLLRLRLLGRGRRTDLRRVVEGVVRRLRVPSWQCAYELDHLLVAEAAAALGARLPQPLLELVLGVALDEGVDVGEGDLELRLGVGEAEPQFEVAFADICLLYTSPSPRDS